MQLALAREAAPSAWFVQADFTRFHLVPGCLDAVASFYALGHVPADRHAALFERIATWLRPGGLLLTSAPLDVGNAHDDDWLGVPMFFGGIGQNATREALQRVGLVVDEWDVLDEDEGDGRVASFLWLVAHKPGSG